MKKIKKYKNGGKFELPAQFWKRMINSGKVQSFEEGGEFQGFKQYDAPTHEQGGLNIDVNGNPTITSPKGQIEGKENKIKYFNLPDKSGKEYIFSDENKTSMELKSFMKKFKKNHDVDTDDISRNMMELKAKDLEFKNEMINSVKQQEQQQGIPEFNLGGGFNPILGMAFNAISGMAKQQGNDALDPTRFDYNQNNQITPRPDILDIPNKLPNLNPQINIKPSNLTATNNFTIPQDSDQVSTLKDKPGSGFLESLQSPDISNEQLLSGLGYGIKGVQAFQNATKDNLILPDYSKADEKYGAMNANLDSAKNEALNSSNLTSNLNRSSVSNFNQFSNRQNQNFANLQKNLASISLNEQQLKNNILSQQGQYEQGKSVLNRNLQDDIQIRNLQNVARTKDLRGSFANDILGEADRLGAIKNSTELANASLQEAKLLLNNMFPNFELDDESINLLQKYSRGEITDDQLKTNFIKFK